MKLLFLVLALVSGPDIIPSIVRLSGVTCIEELSESEIERFESLARDPIDINHASRSALLRSGLFSSYQATSILDYIERYGAIASLAEFSAIDGIGPQRARDMAPFVRFNPASTPARTKADLMLRRSLSGGALKTTLSTGKGFGAAYSMKNGESVSMNLSYKGDGALQELVIGDFNARFGQGLVCWNGFLISSLGSISSFARSGSGISPSSTLSAGSSRRGVAAELGFGRFQSSLFATLDRQFAAHLRYDTKIGTYGATALYGPDATMISGDYRLTLHKWTLFGEVSSNLSAKESSIRAGTFYNKAYQYRSGALLRLSHDEFGASIGTETPTLSASVDALWRPRKGTHQLKGLVLWTRKFEPCGFILSPSARISLRYRPEDAAPWRNELRLDVSLSPLQLPQIQANMRFDLVGATSTALLGYLELGWKGECSAFVRGTLFRADNWNDRIYAYERDSPGSFNVPAYYGHGYALSIYLAHKGLALRLATVQYPWSGKDAKWEAKVQLNLKFLQKRKSQKRIPSPTPSTGEKA